MAPPPGGSSLSEPALLLRAGNAAEISVKIAVTPRGLAAISPVEDLFLY